MTQKEILEGNRLIAEFMGGIYKSDRFVIDDGWVFLPFHNMQQIKRLKYNSSWDWLIPVYNKFTSDLDIAWKITSKGVFIHNHNNGYNSLFEVNCPENVIVDAYRGAVNFIKWYNKNK